MVVSPYALLIKTNKIIGYGHFNVNVEMNLQLVQPRFAEETLEVVVVWGILVDEQLMR